MILRSDLTTPPAVGCRRHMQHRSGVSLASIECPNRTSRATNDAPWSLANDTGRRSRPENRAARQAQRLVRPSTLHRSRVEVGRCESGGFVYLWAISATSAATC